MPNSPTAAQVAEILAFEAGQQTPAGTILFAAAGTGDRAVQTAAAAAYDMAGWTTVANERARRAEKRRAATPRTCPTGCCIDGLVTIRTADGPELTACLADCCRETREAARAERAAIAATTTAFDRLPVAAVEEF